MKKLLIISFLLLVGNNGFSQESDLDNGSYNIQAPIVAEYHGGHAGYTFKSLVLRKDSTFNYLAKYHNQKGFIYNEGTYTIQDSIIVLCSDGYIPMKNKKEEKPVQFKNSTFRMRGNTILMYTVKEEKKDKQGLVKAYQTLHKITAEDLK